MGFLQVVNGSEMDEEKLTALWEFSPSKVVENGSKVIVRKNEILVHVNDNKAVDVITEPGGYVYHSDIEPNQGTTAYAEVITEFLSNNRGISRKGDIKLSCSREEDFSPDWLRDQLQVLDAQNKRNNVQTADSNEWICKCGMKNNFNFCKNCGTPRPTVQENKAEPAPAPAYEPTPAPEPKPQAANAVNTADNTDGTWICEKCGTKNKYAFCKSCGTPRPQEPEVKAEPEPAPAYESTPAPEPKPQAANAVNTAVNTSEIWLCEKCGSRNKYAFCKICGALRPTVQENKVEPAPAPEPKPPVSSAANTAVNTGEIWICGKCGSKNAYSFCKSCGALRSPDSEIYIETKPALAYEPKPQTSSAANTAVNTGEIWICGKCGSKNAYSFCKSCGALRSPDSEIYIEPKPALAYEPKPQTSSVANTAVNTGEIWICEKCGTKNEHSFCKNCGASRSSGTNKDSKISVTVCPKCGMDLKKYHNEKYCPRCGNYIRKG